MGADVMDDLPAGFKLDEPAAAADLPAGFKLDETAPASGIPPNGPSAKEKELRLKYLNDMMQAGEPGYSQRLKDSATWGLMRPLGGVMRGVGGLFGSDNSSFGERYRAGVGAESDYADRAVANTPGLLGHLTDIAGSVGSAGGGAPAAAAGQALPAAGKEALKGAVKQGAIAGGVEGAARNAEDPVSAAEGAGIGAAMGAGTAGAVGALARKIPGIGAAPGIKGAVAEAVEANRGATPEELKAAAKTLYSKLDSSGIGFAQNQTNDLKLGLDSLKATNQYDPIAHSKISGYFNKLEDLTNRPQGVTFTELHNLRSALAKESRGTDASTREAASKINKEIDRMVQRNQPAINPNNVDIKTDYPEATRLWRAATMAEDVNWTAGKAERAAQSKAGVNPDEANRGAFATVSDRVNAPGKYNPYSQEQKDLLAKIIAGDKGQNFYRNIGAAAGSPVTRSLLGLAAVGTGVGTGGVGPLVSALGGGAAVGGAVQKGLNRLAANRGAENIDALVRSITQSQPKQLSKEALAALMAKRIAQQGGGAYAGSLTGGSKQ